MFLNYWSHCDTKTSATDNEVAVTDSNVVNGDTMSKNAEGYQIKNSWHLGKAPLPDSTETVPRARGGNYMSNNETLLYPFMPKT